MNALAVVEHLRNLAADPQNRATIVKDEGCLAGLVLFLDNEDIKVVTTALEALNFLADYPPNRTSMKGEIGMVISLKTLKNKEGCDARVHILARNIYHKIIPQPRNRIPSRASQGSTNSHSFFLGASNKKAKLVVLQIKGLKNVVSRRLCEDQMLKTKGVISFTFELLKSRMIVRCKHELSPEALCQIVNQTKLLNAQQVIKNECGEEVMLSFGMGPSTNCRDIGSNNHLPDYLPEDENEPVISDKALAKIGGDNKENGGWFGSVTNFISKSLYW